MRSPFFGNNLAIIAVSIQGVATGAWSRIILWHGVAFISAHRTDQTLRMLDGFTRQIWPSVVKVIS
jgi:hypothetical protein